MLALSSIAKREEVSKLAKIANVFTRNDTERRENTSILPDTYEYVCRYFVVSYNQ